MRVYRFLRAALAALLLLAVPASAQTDFSGFGFSVPALQFGTGGFFSAPQKPAAVTAAAAFAPGAVTLDGTNDYQSRGADWTGSADSKVGIWSAWLKHGADGDVVLLYDDAGSASRISKGVVAANRIQILLRDATVTTALSINTATAHTAVSGWHHYLAVWDLAAGTSSFYVDGADDQNAVTNANAAVDWTKTDHFLGAADGGLSRYNGSIAEWYLNTAQTLSIAAALPKFYSGGRPVDLGATCQLPTGTAPIQCFKHVTGAAATDFGTNLGTGGGDTITGAYVQATGP